MDRKLSKPQHASYHKHRSQVAWQIILPIVLAGLIMAGLIVLVSLATFRGNGDVSRWAAISTIWLVIPVMIAGLIILVLLAGIAWVLGRATGYIPPYSRQAQQFARQVEAGVKRGAQYVHRPRTLLPEIGNLVRSRIRRMRDG